MHVKGEEFLKKNKTSENLMPAFTEITIFIFFTRLFDGFAGSVADHQTPEAKHCEFKIYQCVIAEYVYD